MAEEEKKEAKSSETLKTLAKYLLGVVLILVGLWLIKIWFVDFMILVRACVGPFLVFAGLITVLIAKS